MSKQIYELLCEQTYKVETCTDADSFYAEVRRAQEVALGALVRSSRNASASIVEAFEALGTHQRRRRILELILWPVLDKPALPSEGIALPDFVWQFQVPVVVTLSPECLSKTTVLNPLGLDVDEVGAALVDSDSLRGVSMLACWPSLYRREDFYAYGPLQLAQRMVELFRGGEADVVQPLPLILDPEIPHARVVTLHLWVGARVPVGATELLSREPLGADASERIGNAVQSYLNAQGIGTEAVSVQEPQHMAEGYFLSSPAWQCELVTSLKLAAQQFETGEVRLQLPVPGYFELLAQDRSILVPATAAAQPRLGLKADIAMAVEASGLKLAGSFSPTIPVSGMTH